MTHAEQVTEYFHNPSPYLQRSYNILLRREIIVEMLGDEKRSRILDVGCGDGSLSLQLLGEDNSLLLVDISENMLAVARSAIPLGLAHNVETICGDLMGLHSLPTDFDLVLCMGVIAHVESPSAFISKACSLLKPGGTMIVTVSCGHHLAGRLRRLYLGAKNLLRRSLYRLNWPSIKEVLDDFSKQGMSVQKSYRYNFPPPTFDRLFSNERLYRSIRRRHGSVADNRLAWLGSEYILMLTKAN